MLLCVVMFFDYFGNDGGVLIIDCCVKGIERFGGFVCLGYELIGLYENDCVVVMFCGFFV